jgi:hypothetical protein
VVKFNLLAAHQLLLVAWQCSWWLAQIAGFRCRCLARRAVTQSRVSLVQARICDQEQRKADEEAHCAGHE